jgi:hypothetical protein
VKALLVGAILLLGAREVHAGACARYGVAAELRSIPADPIPPDGGVLVAYGQPTDDQPVVEDGDPSAHREWRFRARSVKGKKLRPTMVTIAPGLSVYRTKQRGKVVLTNRKGKKLGVFTMSRKKAPFDAPAPVLKSVVINRYSSSRGGTSVGAIATLDAVPPAGAYAIVVYDTASGTARSWGLTGDNTSAVLGVYSSPGRCSQNPPGMEAPSAGQSIEVAWVDSFGRISPHSNAVTVSEGSSGTTGGL